VTGPDTFAFDHRRVTAALALDSAHFDEMQRLAKVLRHGGGFQFLILEFNDEAYRNQLADAVDAVLNSVGIPSQRINLVKAGFADVLAFEADVRSRVKGNCALHIFGGDAWFDTARIESFNIRREAFAQIGPVKLLFWLTTHKIAQLATLAPDFWSWRGSAVFSFQRAVVINSDAPPPSRGMQPVDPRTLRERGQRIAELRGMLNGDAVPAMPDEARGLLLDELAGLLESLGQLDEALRIRREDQLPLYEKLGDVRRRAMTMGKIAYVLQARGELDEALHMLKEDVLPQFANPVDVRLRAVTMGKIADILQTRGELDEALRIHMEDELPVYKKLGDVRERAVTMGKIADILQARGELDEALRIRKDEQLPVYEKLGDVRERAMSMGKIADVLQARGELDEALRILKDEVSPTFEKLGDLRSRAATMGKIAGILQARGELDEALRIRKEEELPVYEKLGDVRSRLVAEANLGQLYVLKGEPDRAHELWRKALADAQRLQIPEAGIIERWLKSLNESI
jgi:tetratricopeptide (TPR) repeat protein